MANSAHSALRNMALLANMISATPYSDLLSMPYVPKNPKPIRGTALTCSKCGFSHNGTLKKIGRDKYICSRCLREGEYLDGR